MSGPAARTGFSETLVYRSAVALQAWSGRAPGGVKVKGPASYRTAGSAQNWPLSQPDIDQYGAQLFSKWGGLDKAKECFPDLNWTQ